jgi:hypothetical protein
MVSRANRLAESKDPYYLCTAAWRQGVLPVLRTMLGLLSELPERPPAVLSCKGSFDCDLSFAKRKTSLRSG